MHESLFETAEQHRLSVKHAIAACNALCSFLDHGWSSPIPEVQIYCQSRTTWHRLLDLFLYRGHEPSVKPMKQVLTTLMKILLRSSERTQETALDTQSSLAKEATVKCLVLLETNEDISSIKPCMTVFQALLSKNLIDPEIVISLLPSIQVHNRLPNGLLAVSFEESVSRFVWAVLRWVRHSNISLVGARLISSFFMSLHVFHKYDSGTATRQPLWASPILKFAVEGDSMLEIAEMYILPNILRINATDTRNFISGLSLMDMQNGDIDLLSEMEIRFCLLVTKITNETELSAALDQIIHTKANSDDTTTATEDESRTMIEYTDLSARERIASACLTHPSSTIRNAALSALVHNQATSSPFSPATIQTMKETLPLFYTESNNRARNECLSTIKRVCLRLHDSITKLQKTDPIYSARERSDAPPPDATEIALTVQDRLDDHVNFVQWLFSFCCGELQATASYQRHIMTLKVLQLVHEAGLLNFLDVRWN